MLLGGELLLLFQLLYAIFLWLSSVCVGGVYVMGVGERKRRKEGAIAMLKKSLSKYVDGPGGTCWPAGGSWA